MTVPSYTEDLNDIATGDEAIGWVELTGTDQDGKLYNAQGAPAYQDNEYPYIQGLYAVTQDCTKNVSVGSLAYNAGGITIPTDGAVFVWHAFSSPFAFGTYAQGGYRIVLGSGLSDFNVWYTGGQNKGRMPYGGFECHVVNPTVTRDNWAGTHTGTINYVGSAVYVVSGPGKGEPHQVDVMRYGRGSAIFEHGEAANYATIAGFAAQNDNQSYRWGLIQASPYGYLWQGRMQLGTVTNAVHFVDENRNIFVNWTPKVTANFNLIEIINEDSTISMTGFTFQVLDTTTASKGRFLMTDPATLTLDQCSFVDMDTFIFNFSVHPVQIIDSIFRRCAQITQAGATFSGCRFLTTTAASALVSNNPDEISACYFESDGSSHAIELTAACNGNTYYVYNCQFDNYAAVDGSGGNETIYNNSGGPVTIYLYGTTSTISVQNSLGSSTTIIKDPVDITVNVVTTAGADLVGARVFLKASDGSGGLPFEEPVTIENSGVTATVTHAGDHNLLTDDHIEISGASLYQNNGVFPITVSDSTSYVYTMLNAPGSNPTGTILATFVALYGLSGGDGIVTASRVYEFAQPVVGWSRKATSAPYYKTADLIGEVDTLAGYTSTAVMILDQ